MNINFVRGDSFPFKFSIKNKQEEPMDELVENTINEIQNNLEGE